MCKEKPVRPVTKNTVISCFDNSNTMRVLIYKQTNQQQANNNHKNNSVPNTLKLERIILQELRC